MLKGGIMSIVLKIKRTAALPEENNRKTTVFVIVCNSEESFTLQFPRLTRKELKKMNETK